jgi:hypothetical protein
MRFGLISLCVPLLVTPICLQSASAQNAAVGTTDKLQNVTTISAKDNAESLAALKEWTGWDGTAGVTLKPGNPFLSFGTPICQPSGACQLSRNLYIIHIVDWKASQGSVSFDTGQWFLYRYDAKAGKYYPINADGDSFPDVYDMDNGTVISVSRLTVPKNDPQSLTIPPPRIDYTITVTQNTPSWLTGLQTIISGISGVTVPNVNHGAVRSNPSPVIKTTITVQAISTSTLKRPYTVAVSGAAAASTDDSAGDCKNLTKNSKCTFTNNLSVAQREFVTFGINIVPHGPKETTFDSTGTPTTTNHNAFYAVVDFTPFPIHWPMDSRLYVQAGLPLSGAATHLPYVGVAYPLPWFKKTLAVSPFYGVVFMQQQGPNGKRDRVTKGIWGVEVPLTSISGLFTKATGDKKKGS